MEIVCRVVCYMAVKLGWWRKRASWHSSGMQWERLGGCVVLKQQTGSLVLSWKRDLEQMI